jgi:hypothetical protein
MIAGSFRWHAACGYDFQICPRKEIASEKISAIYKPGRAQLRKPTKRVAVFFTAALFVFSFQELQSQAGLL